MSKNMTASTSTLSGLTAWIVSALSLPNRTKGRAPDQIKLKLRGLTAPAGFDLGKVVRASTPKDFRPFSDRDLKEARGLFELIREDHQKVMENTYEAVKARFKADERLATELPFSIRLEMAEAVKRQAKARMKANRDRLREILHPGLMRLAAAMEEAAEEYAASEQAAANSLGIDWEPSCIVRAAAHAAEYIRERWQNAGNALNLSDATMGFVAE